MSVGAWLAGWRRGGISPLRARVVETFAARASAAGVAFLTSVVVSRALGPEGRGSFAAAMALAMIGTQLACLGVQSANAYFVARDRYVAGIIATHSLLLGLGAGSIVALALGAVAGVFGLMDKLDITERFFALALIPFGLTYQLLINLLLGLTAARWFNSLEIGSRVLNLSIVLLLALVVSGTVNHYLAATVAVQAVAAGCAWFAVLRRGVTPARFSMPVLDAQLRYGVRAWLASFLAYLLVRIDLLMVQDMVGNQEAGLYSIAVALADVLYMLPSAIATMLFPRLTQADALSEQRRLLHLGLIHTAWATVAFAAASVAVAGPFIGFVFGEAFAPAAPMFAVLALAMVFYGVNNILSHYIAARGLPWFGVWVWLPALALNLVLNVLWIPRWGGVGAAWASVAAYLFAMAGQLLYVSRRR